MLRSTRTIRQSRDELPEDPYSDVEDNFQFENMPEPPEEPDMNNDLDMSLD